MKAIETTLESWVFRSRWLLAPFFIGLLLAIIPLLLKFAKSLWVLALEMFTLSAEQMIISILSLVDGALIASLLLIIGFSGYENFVSKIGVGEHEDRPAWMGKVGFSDLKIKLMGAIVAISAVELLKAFINVDANSPWQPLAWRVGIHITFVVSGVLFAITDRIVESKPGAGH
ncbi:MAG TPA: TIGR00645 family protein [Gammaproteobacteria bacterium]|nr:TIGR00645 family protein [Gammaproteobacteria bacterium]